MTRACCAKVSEAGTKDVDRAVEAARKAFRHGRRCIASERGRLLFKLADAIEADRDYLSVTRNASIRGHPIRDTQNLDSPRTVATFRYMAGIADKIDGRVVQVNDGFHNYVLREPLGVVGSLCRGTSRDVRELEAESGACSRQRVRD